MTNAEKNFPTMRGYLSMRETLIQPCVDHVLRVYTERRVNKMKEFSHLEIRAVRNPKWLEPHDKRGFFLSTGFLLGEFEMGRFKDHTEGNIEELWEFFENLMKDNGFIVCQEG